MVLGGCILILLLINLISFTNTQHMDVTGCFAKSFYAGIRSSEGIYHNFGDSQFLFWQNKRTLTLTGLLLWMEKIKIEQLRLDALEIK